MSVELSVIIPAYNSEYTIEKCINSVINECENNNLEYEILVIDDGSKDNTAEIVKNLIKKNKNIKLFYQENSGPSEARNNGLRNASGKYIALNDSDDEWFEGKLKLQLDILKNNENIDLLSGQFGNVKSKKEKLIKVTFRKEAFHNYFATSTIIFKNTIKNKFFPINMKYSEDMRFFITVMEDFNCYIVKKVLVKNIFSKRNWGDSGLSSKLKEMEYGELSNLKYMYKKHLISLGIFCLAVPYSYAKYIRRFIYTKINRNKDK